MMKTSSTKYQLKDTLKKTQKPLKTNDEQMEVDKEMISILLGLENSKQRRLPN